MFKIFSYWWFPVISGAMWLTTLLGLLLHWIIDTHRTHYDSMGPDQRIAYISDVGAAELKPLFVAGCIITTIFLDLSFGADRWLRHKGRLVPNTTVTEKVLAGLTIVFAIAGTVGLTCLSGFDTAHYPRLHDIFLAVFIGGYLISAIFICWEYQRMGIKNREHRILRISFWIKLMFIFIELGLAIAFGVMNRRKMYDIAAILEWVVSFVFSFYIFSFYVDLYPAVKTSRGGVGFKPAGMNMSERELEENYHAQNDIAVNPRYTQDSSRPINGNQNGHHGRHTNF
ncbi:Frag1/DRAM/Sfk1 family protein [Truncatella angustata]|uniref:Frag1/DRAM/Sfk1 family protein n=1 Tax=Truncatella angustata TaxID=152316 RepID=A0A9P8ZU68_9PEZI|nr:Frag1/DRAM/Sfk1 family protein [Truncatella angustata]KAH6648907.1 Frag1/DRAM/Sfk1 family protein [Truncatella angustata]KAH8198875.1 hypothetical protein TruAng_006983 [Truncatella angustata]